MAYDKIVDSAALDNGLGAVADAIRGKSGAAGALAFPEGFVGAVESIPAPVPKGANIKYIIPCRYTPPRTADGLGFDAVPFTFSRENVNQMFFVNWELQDPTDDTAPYWIQHIIWAMCFIGNYSSMHNINLIWCGHGTKGNATGSKNYNYPRANLTGLVTFAELVGATGYNFMGQNYRGLLFITDSTYEGMPMVDESKLTDFITCDYVQAGWG